jgi:ribosomal protein S18 acetylase RimI-like enzyme
MYHTERMSVSIRAMVRKDIEPSDRMLMRAFATTESFRWIIEREFAIQPEYYWVSEAAGEVTGNVAAIRYGSIAYIGMMGVDPAFQGRGIGRALLETAIETLERDGCTTMLLDATDAGEPLYRKCGFVDEGSSYDLLGTPANAAGDITLIADPNLLIAFDADVFGANRRHAIERLLAEPGARCLQIDKGYLVAQRTVLGPWVAKDPRTAEALLAQCEQTEYRVIMPTENKAGLLLLQRTGFEVRREVRHMRRGRRFSREGRAITYGQASFALG